MTVEIGKVGDMLTIAQWIAVRNAVARRLDGGTFTSGVEYRPRAEKLLRSGYIDVAEVLRSLEAKPEDNQ